jgi:putative phage-type endonuclease
VWPVLSQRQRDQGGRAVTITLMPGELVCSDTAPREQWMAARRTGIGASEIAAVAGLSIHRGPWDVWAAKMEGREFESTDDMRWGTFIEQRIIDWWAAETGRTVGNGGLFRHPVHRWLLATPDAIVLEPPAEVDPVLGRYPAGLVPTEVVDAKNAGFYRGGDWDEDGAPIEYIVQSTQQMLAVGVGRGQLVASIGGKPPVSRGLVLDDDLAGSLIAFGEEFWQHVQDGTPPPVDGSRSARRWLAAKYPDADPDSTKALDDEHVEALRQQVAIDYQIGQLKRMSDEIENRIQQHLGSAAEGTYDGKTYVTWKKVNRKGYTVEPGSYRKFHVPKAIVRELGGNG